MDVHRYASIQDLLSTYCVPSMTLGTQMCGQSWDRKQVNFAPTDRWVLSFWLVTNYIY